MLPINSPRTAYALLNCSSLDQTNWKHYLARRKRESNQASPTNKTSPSPSPFPSQCKVAPVAYRKRHRPCKAILSRGLQKQEIYTLLCCTLSHTAGQHGETTSERYWVEPHGTGVRQRSSSSLGLLKSSNSTEPGRPGGPNRIGKYNIFPWLGRARRGRATRGSAGRLGWGQGDPPPHPTGEGPRSR